MNRSIFTLLILVVLSSHSFAQLFESTLIPKSEYEIFKSTKLKVVTGLLGDEFDEQVKQVLEENWTFSEYTFVNLNEFKVLCQTTDEFNYFLIPCPSFIHYNTPGDDFPLRSDCLHLKIARGTPEFCKYIEKVGLEQSSKLRFVKNSRGLANIFYSFGNPMKYANSGSEAKRQAQEYLDSLRAETPVDTTEVDSRPFYFSKQDVMIPILIKNLQWQFNENKVGRISSGAFSSKKVEKGLPEMFEVPTYVLESDLNEIVESDITIKAYFNGDVKIVSKEEYAELINSTQNVNIFLSLEDMGYNYAQVFNVKSGKLLFYKRHPITKKATDGLSPSHLKTWEFSRKRAEAGG
ncbi:MAG: hypothetical protein AB8B56_10145 [Crocinitomicaceae bacterium]